MKLTPYNKTLLKLPLLVCGMSAVTAPVEAQTPAATTPGDTSQPVTPAATGQPASDTPHRARRFQLGVELGVSRYTDARTRDRFGDGFFIAPTLFPLSPASTKGTVQPDLDFTYSRRHGNRLIMGLLGAEYRRALTGDGSLHPATQFHVGANLGLVPASIRSPMDGVDSGLKMGVGGGVSAGYLIKQRVDLNVRYTAISRIQGFNLSNLRAEIEVKF